VCGAAYTTAEVINPYSAVSGAKPVMKHPSIIFQTLRAQLPEVFAGMDDQCTLQAEAANKMQNGWAQR